MEAEMGEKETFRVDDICEKLIGQRLLKLEHSGEYSTREEAEEAGDRWTPLGHVIKHAYIGFTECREDPCIWLTLDDEDETETYAFASEDITVEKVE